MTPADDDDAVNSGHDLFSLLRKLESSQAGKPRIGENATRLHDVVALGQHAHVDHSSSNVELVSPKENGSVQVLSRFMGLLGPQGALPLHTAYEAVHWQTMRDEAFVRFLDIFNNRFQQLFFRAWANARPIVQADRPHDNQFRVYLGSHVGIGTPAMRGRDSLHDYTKLGLAGLLSPSVKSASRLKSMLAWLFKINVDVQQFVGIWLPLEPAEQASLAPGSCGLGVDCIIGRSAYSLSDKFRVKFLARDIQEFESLLPDGRFFWALTDAIRFYLGEIFIYDVEIGLAEASAPAMQLGGFGRLGWTSWVKRAKPGGDGSAAIRWDCRYYPNEIIAQEDVRQSKES